MRITPNFNIPRKVTLATQKASFSAVDSRDSFAPSKSLDVVSFRSNGPPPLKKLTQKELDKTFMMLGVQDVPCACCGRTTLNAREFAKLKPEMFSKSCVKSFEILDKYENYMQESERATYKAIREVGLKNPDKNLQEVLVLMRPEYLKRLVIKEFKIIDGIDKLSNNLPYSSFLEIRKITTNARKIIIDNNKENPFKRQMLIAEIAKLQDTLPEKDIARQARELAEKLPKSTNNKNAFIVKYSGKIKKNETTQIYEHANSYDIARRLLITAIATKEHVKPESEGGASAQNNYIVECAKCNNSRRSIPLDEWVKEHPSMPENAQKYLDFVINLINNGTLRNYEWYPLVISETLVKQSKGLLNPDYSRLKSIELAKEQIDGTSALIEKFNKKATFKAKQKGT